MSVILQIKLSSAFATAILFLLLFAASIEVRANAALTNEMSFEDALLIARQSVQRASGMRLTQILLSGKSNKQISNLSDVQNCLSAETLDYFNKNPNEKQSNDTLQKFQTILNNCLLQKRIQLNYSLGYVGLHDEFRLDALRRYIARNTEIGVKSIWGRKNGYVQSYIITYEQLAEITAKTKIIELATLIKNSAGLPSLPLATSAQVVANCRNHISKANPKIPTSENVLNDIGKGNLVRLVSCLSNYQRDPKTNLEFGVPSVKFRDSSGDLFSYYLSKGSIDKIKSSINSPTYRYNNMIDDLSKLAIVPHTPEFLATTLVVNSLAELESAGSVKKVERKSFKLITLFPKLEERTRLQTNLGGRYDETQIDHLEFCKNLGDSSKCIEALVAKLAELSTPPNNPWYFFSKPQGKTIELMPLNPDGFSKVSSSDTVGKLIDTVTTIITNQK